MLTSLFVSLTHNECIFQWAVVRDWEAEEGVESPRNIVLCSMPSLIDPSLAPEGKHVLHAYVPGEYHSFGQKMSLKCRYHVSFSHPTDFSTFNSLSVF